MTQLALWYSFTRPKSRSRQVCDPVGGLGWICFQSHWGCWQKSVLSSYQTVVPIACCLSARGCSQLPEATSVPGLILRSLLFRASTSSDSWVLSVCMLLTCLGHRPLLFCSPPLLFFLLYQAHVITLGLLEPGRVVSLSKFVSSNLNSTCKLPFRAVPRVMFDRITVRWESCRGRSLEAGLLQASARG